MMGDFYNSIQDYTKCISLDEKNSEAYYNRGVIYKLSSKYQEAINDFNVAISINPNSIDAFQNRGIMKSYLKDKSALNDFNDVIKLDQKNGEAFYNRAIYFLNFNPKNDYCSDLKKAIDLGFELAIEVYNEKCLKKK